MKKQLEKDRKAKRREILERNFDKRDDWSNVKPHCHALNEHEEGLMVLPEFKINHKYYSIILCEDFIQSLNKYCVSMLVFRRYSSNLNFILL